MEFAMRKTTLGEYNNGHCNSPNNCYYTGKTVCWEIINLDATGEFDVQVCAVSRKKDAVKLVAFLNSINYDLRGDPVSMFRKHCKTIADWDAFDIKEV